MSASLEQRKLTAIMFTDLVGYSALAQREEVLDVGKSHRHYPTM